MVKEAAKRPTVTLKELQDFLISTVFVLCDNNLLNSTFVWTKKQKWKTEPFALEHLVLAVSQNVMQQ